MKLSYEVVLVFLVLCICIAESVDPLGDSCNKESEISKGSKISANIDSLLPELALKTPPTGFATGFSGKGEDRVYGLAQCRGDVSTEDCSSCVQDAAKQIKQRCPNEADARIWYDYCFLRYNNKSSFIGQVNTSPGILYANVQDVNDPESFKKVLGALMDQIRGEAVEPKNEGLGKGQTQISTFQTLYALVQCTRDLAHIDCAQCLAIALENFDNFCNNKKGCRVLYSSCYVRYELYPFFFPLASDNSTVSDHYLINVVKP
ncbi:cysteine-rich repeat secretory protein 55-like [Humulus lupulus]|uniref:cysteine-rich repeat secretory protein 55-like n=1 Tax=Humulus lupulus TaxID=3486 RepID=UPI002B40B327|nr:cysteine-rich repeat secretory protein 55-like [Humulus lupulus]